MIQCKCGKTLKRFELLPLSTSQDCIIYIDNWRHCPYCNEPLDVPSTLTRLEIKYNSAVLQISNDEFDSASNALELATFLKKYQSPTTYLHLKRILDFTVLQNELQISGYKNYSQQIFTLHIKSNFEYESHILLKIIHSLHSKKYRCESKTIDNQKRWGNWSTITKTDYPLSPCSFCARFDEYRDGLEHNQPSNNNWPLSLRQIEKIKLDEIKHMIKIPTNNKFAKIFTETQNTQHTICCCNEIRNTFCKIHKSI